ncbi:MAG TPA: ATP-binding protein [Elusimicrobia bacterium]|jgi:anti-sigma regulatory factor (Ser/Thr protein kinase)|nr:ATP-binding protein [Elusimicrobiota bacterium]
MEHKTFVAKMENLELMINFILVHARKQGFDEKMLGQIHLVAEEALVNVVNYGYPGKTGDIEIACGPAEDKQGILIEIVDSGIPFNPLEKPEPDINLPLEERGIGGLGIFMIKKIMDKVTYKRENDKNFLSLVKYVGSTK